MNCVFEIFLFTLEWAASEIQLNAETDYYHSYLVLTNERNELPTE